MAQVRITYDASDVLRKLGAQGARELRDDIDREIERSVRTMANNSAQNAPVKTGKLRASIPASVEQHGEMDWEFGSPVPYATKQEYEHRTKRAFLRNAVWSETPVLKAKISEVIRSR